MKIQYFKEYSFHLDRDMEYKIYGHAGKVCFVFPCQSGRFYEWEDRRMFEAVQDLIDAGKVQFCTVDSVDDESWTSSQDVSSRMAIQEKYVQYIVDELVPDVAHVTHQAKDTKYMVTGASLGATHAAICFLRFPAVFDTILGMSGVYDVHDYFAGYKDLNTTRNNPIEYLENMDDSSLELVRSNKMIFAVGQGAWEDHCKKTLDDFSEVLKKNGVKAWVDYWGYDVDHDWHWWKKMFDYFMHTLV